MKEFIFYVIAISLLAAFLLTLLRKWGVIEWVQVHGNDFFSKMFSCDFCLSWWMGVVLSVAGALIVNDPAVLLIPFFSTALTRRLL